MSGRERSAPEPTALPLFGCCYCPEWLTPFGSEHQWAGGNRGVLPRLPGPGNDAGYDPVLSHVGEWWEQIDGGRRLALVGGSVMARHRDEEGHAEEIGHHRPSVDSCRGACG